MIASAAAAAILEALVERNTIGSKVMIVAAHPDDETIGMGAQLCRFRDALLVQVTDGAPRDGRDAHAHGFATIAGMLLPRGPNSLQRSKSDKRAVSEPNSLVSPTRRLVSISTNEIMTRLAEWNLLGLDLTVLDIGCGIRSIELALAPLVGMITAIDISPHMIDEARRRSRDLANVKFHQCNGRDLTAFDDRSFDLILAVDSIPCVFAADPEIAVRHIRDCARRLRSGGTLLILNFSYRGDEADRRDVQQLAAAYGFTVTFRHARFLVMGRAYFFAQAYISPRMNASVLARAS